MSASVKRRMGAGILAIAIAASALASSPAMAKNGRNAAAIAGGVLGGIAAGAIVSGATRGYAARPAYQAYPVEPAYGPDADYGPADCGGGQPVYDAYGNFAGYQRVPGC